MPLDLVQKETIDKMLAALSGLSAVPKPGKKLSDYEFAKSLIEQAHNKGYLSSSQWYWVHKLTETAKTPSVDAQGNIQKEIAADMKAHDKLFDIGYGTQYVGSNEKLVALFKNTESHLMQPMIVVPLVNSPGSYGLIFQLMKGGKFPGSIGVYRTVAPNHSVAKAWRRFVGWWNGLALTFGKGDHKLTDEFAKIMTAMSEDPVNLMASAGKISGKCCYCNSPLEDSKSLAVGYGPVCAKHWGLLWGGKAAAKVAGTTTVKTNVKTSPATTATKVLVATEESNIGTPTGHQPILGFGELVLKQELLKTKAKYPEKTTDAIIVDGTVFSDVHLGAAYAEEHQTTFVLLTKNEDGSWYMDCGPFPYGMKKHEIFSKNWTAIKKVTGDAELVDGEIYDLAKKGLLLTAATSEKMALWPEAFQVGDYVFPTSDLAKQYAKATGKKVGPLYLHVAGSDPAKDQKVFGQGVPLQMSAKPQKKSSAEVKPSAEEQPVRYRLGSNSALEALKKMLGNDE